MSQLEGFPDGTQTSLANVIDAINRDRKRVVELVTPYFKLFVISMKSLAKRHFHDLAAAPDMVAFAEAVSDEMFRHAQLQLAFGGRGSPLLQDKMFRIVVVLAQNDLPSAAQFKEAIEVCDP